MRFRELLEGATDVLYHYTNLHAAADVFSAEAFRLSTALGTQAELDLQPPGYPYYFSTTRSKTGSYHRHVGKNAVMFVLDGQWFQQRYPVKPVDYWAGMNADRKEAEDRVYSRDSEIPLGGVRAVHILFRESGGTESSLLRKILIASKTQGIQTYVYDDESAWRLQDRRKALDTEALLSVAQGEMDPEYRAWTRQREVLQTQEEPRGVSAWNELIRTPATQYDNLSKNAQKIAYDFRYDKEYYWRSRVESLKTDIHNSKSQRSGFEYPEVVKLTKLMRQAGLKSIADLVQYMRDKWRLKESLETDMKAQEILTEAPKKKAPKVPFTQGPITVLNFDDDGVTPFLYMIRNQSYLNPDRLSLAELVAKAQKKKSPKKTTTAATAKKSAPKKIKVPFTQGPITVLSIDKNGKPNKYVVNDELYTDSGPFHNEVGLSLEALVAAAQNNLDYMKSKNKKSTEKKSTTKKQQSDTHYDKVPLEIVDFPALAKQTVKYIKDNAEPWLAASKNGQLVVYRGVENSPQQALAWTKPVRQDRRPKDSSQTLHDRFNAIIAAAGGTANRSNAAFVTSSFTGASHYGSVYVYIPLGDFTYTWSPFYTDWTEDFGHDTLNKAMIKRSLSMASPESYDRKQAKYLVKVNTGLADAVKKQHEIMIRSDQGLFVKNSFYLQYVLPLLQGVKTGVKKK